MRFHVTIKNQGDTPTPAPVKHGVLFTVGGQNSSHVWSDTFYGSLGVGDQKSLDTNGGRGGATCNPSGGPTTSPLWPGVSGQSYSVEVWVDNATDSGFTEYGHIKESDEFNNIWKGTFSVP